MECTFSLENINDVAKKCWDQIGNRTIIAIYGPMGAGKTTLVHALCSIKHVKDQVGSPTFSIINEYSYDCNGTPKLILHMDLYRLKDEEEAIRTGVEDALLSGSTCLVEWPEKAPGIFPDSTVKISIEPLDNSTRRLKIEGI